MKTISDVLAGWRKQPEHQDTMPLSKEAQAVLFARSLCADELEPKLQELRALAEKWSEQGEHISGMYQRKRCALELTELLGPAAPGEKGKGAK